MDFRESDFKELEQHNQLTANTKSIASDIAGATASREMQANAPLGSPTPDYSVRSTYDSRPIQGSDFNITAFISVPACSTTPMVAQFVVPDGYVAVVRELQLVFQPPRPAFEDDVLASFVVDSADVSFNSAVPVGNGPQLPLKTFFIADEKHQVGVKITDNAGILQQNDGIIAMFYGNMLLKTGIPPAYEIANHNDKDSISGRAMTPCPPALPAPVSAPVATAQPAPAESQKRSLLPAGYGGNETTNAPRNALKAAPRTHSRNRL